ncbi:MAG: calcium/sodium antiporter [Acholeplasmataceae bacterium]|nr:calcium/sodium antiporter [Acholeplasmataceae bacterium]
MDLFINIILLLAGFVFLVKGADFFVSSSSSIARRFNVSSLVIGLTLVAFGTSLPELAVSFIASLTVEQGATADIAMGNVVGSNIVNITLILGLTALARPIKVSKTMHKKEFPYLIFSAILITLFAALFQSDYRIVWWESLILLTAFTGYIILMLKSTKPDVIVEEYKVYDTKKSIILLILGIGGVSLGGWMVTCGAESIATNLLVDVIGMSQSKAVTLIGLTIVAIGTSLPEMVTSIVAAKKGENEIAFGNLVGSNIFNVLFILGLSGLFTPLGINQDVMFDLWIMIGLTLVAVISAVTFGFVSKKEGFLLVLIYIFYVTFIVIRALGV